MKTAMLTFALACALTFALVAPAQAGRGFHSGNELLTMCKEDAPNIMIVNCASYIAGVSDGVQITLDTLGRRAPYCMSASVTKGQLRRLVRQYLRAHPERGHLAASGLVLEAILKAFPCKN